MMLTTQTTCQRAWLPQGQYPKIEVTSTRKKRCIYGFLNLLTGQESAFKTEGANSKFTIEALEKIGQIYQKKRMVILWDNASWHRSQELKAFLSQTRYNFHFIHFPPYAPDENPQEHVWKAGRAQVSHNQYIPNIDVVTNDFVSYLNKTRFHYKFLT